MPNRISNSNNQNRQITGLQQSGPQNVNNNINHNNDNNNNININTSTSINNSTTVPLIPGTFITDFEAFDNRQSFQEMSRQMDITLFQYRPDDFISELGSFINMMYRDYLAAGSILRHLTADDPKTRTRAFRYLEKYLRECARRSRNERSGYLQRSRQLFVAQSTKALLALAQAPSNTNRTDGFEQRLRKLSPVVLWFGFHYCRDTFNKLSRYQQAKCLEVLAGASSRGVDLVQNADFGVLERYVDGCLKQLKSSKVRSDNTTLNTKDDNNNDTIINTDQWVQSFSSTNIQIDNREIIEIDSDDDEIEDEVDNEVETFQYNLTIYEETSSHLIWHGNNPNLFINNQLNDTNINDTQSQTVSNHPLRNPRNDRREPTGNHTGNTDNSQPLDTDTSQRSSQNRNTGNLDLNQWQQY